MAKIADGMKKSSLFERLWVGHSCPLGDEEVMTKERFEMALREVLTMPMSSETVQKGVEQRVMGQTVEQIFSAMRQQQIKELFE